MIYPDISHYNSIFDWAAVKENCPFIISKATQGTEYIDPSLFEFIERCETNEIPYWLYTYLDKGNETAQAEFMVRICKGRIGDHFKGYILDVEAGNDETDVRAALDYLNGLNVKTMLYTMYSDYDKYSNLIRTRPSSCAWWEARYGENDGIYNSAYPCHSGADLHQYTDQGTCPGISDEVDLNRLTGTKPETWFVMAKETETGKPEEEIAVIYETIDDIPEWYRPTIEKLIADGSIVGVGNNKLNLSDDVCRTLTILDRNGALKL